MTLSSRTLGSLAALAVIFVGALAGHAYARASQLDELARTVETDHNEKSRIAAVVALGNLADPRSVPTLTRALQDPSPIVRGLAANALGHIGDARAIAALERTLSDDNDGVRARAREALALLRGGELEISADDEPVLTHAKMTPKESPRRASQSPGSQSGSTSIKNAKLYIVVKDMANKAHTSRELVSRMRDVVVKQLSGAPELTLDSSAGDKLAQFNVDGSITKMTREENGPWVEISCEVKLTISNAKGAIVSMVSGGATVQTAKGSYRNEMEAEIQEEALENAVRGAHQNLLMFLVKQIAQK